LHQIDNESCPSCETRGRKDKGASGIVKWLVCGVRGDEHQVVAAHLCFAAPKKLIDFLRFDLTQTSLQHLTGQQTECHLSESTENAFNLFCQSRLSSEELCKRGDHHSFAMEILSSGLKETLIFAGEQVKVYPPEDHHCKAPTLAPNTFALFHW